MRARVVFVASAVVVTVCAAWPSASGGASVAGSARGVAPTVIFGARVEPLQGQSVPQAIQGLEGAIGRSLAAIRVYDLWDQPFPDPATLFMRTTGHALFLSVRAKTTKGKIVPFKDIANAQPGSAVYERIMVWANAVKGFGAHVYFTFNHEPEAADSNPNGTAADFVAAWRRVIDLFRADGVTNAEFVWIMTDYSFWRTDGKAAKHYYPGDAWVDDIAEDAYNWNDCRPGIDNGWRSLQQIVAPMRRFGLQHPGKRLMLTEWGSVEDQAQPGRKAQWISDAATTLKSPGWGSFGAALYFDSKHPGGYPACDWRLTTSASAMSAFAAMGADPYFQAVAPGGGDTTPPSVPGTPTGASHSSTTIDLSWAASTDDQAHHLSRVPRRRPEPGRSGHGVGDDDGRLHRHGPGAGLDAHLSGRCVGRRERQREEPPVGAHHGPGLLIRLRRRLLGRAGELDLGGRTHAGRVAGRDRATVGRRPRVVVEGVRLPLPAGELPDAVRVAGRSSGLGRLRVRGAVPAADRR